MDVVFIMCRKKNTANTARKITRLENNPPKSIAEEDQTG